MTPPHPPAFVFDDEGACPARHARIPRGRIMGRTWAGWA